MNLLLSPMGFGGITRRYEAKTAAVNEEIANWLLRLTDNHRN